MFKLTFEKIEFVKKQFDIKTPCSEDWNKMKKEEGARFCDSCSKSVIDFTEMSQTQISDYLHAQQGNRVCGRLQSSQLPSASDSFAIELIGKRSPKYTNKTPIYVCAMTAILLTACTTNEQKFNTNPPTELHQNIDAINGELTFPEEDFEIEEVELNHAPEDEVTLIDKEVVLGDIVVGIVDSEDESPVRNLTKIAEFPEGTDSLLRFMMHHFKYPEWEKEQEIQGKVIVEFMVSERGEISDVSIVKSVAGARNFDKEAIRLIKLLPDWNPAESNGKAVEAYFYLPITFRLKD